LLADIWLIWAVSKAIICALVSALSWPVVRLPICVEDMAAMVVVLTLVKSLASID